MFLKSSRKKPRIYTLIIYNNDNDYVQINRILETYADILKDIDELRTDGTWLNKQYKGRYKYFLITNGKKTIKELINDEEKERYLL